MAGVKVSAGGFEPGKTYKLNWTRVIGNRMTGQGWEDISLPVAEAKADASGRVEFGFKTPDDLGGTHGLWVEKGKTKTIGTHFIKATALPLDVTKGPVGTKFTIHLKGDVQIFVQATGTPGWHFVDLYPGIYKGTESDPNNFRIPQLTYAQDHPGEDLPAFHFAFEVTAAGQKQASASP